MPGGEATRLGRCLDIVDGNLGGQVRLTRFGEKFCREIEPGDPATGLSEGGLGRRLDIVDRNLGGQVRLQAGDGFTLTLDGVSLAPVAGGNDGVGGEPTSTPNISDDGIAGPIVNVINGGMFNPFFVVNDVRVNIDP